MPGESEGYSTCRFFFIGKFERHFYSIIVTRPLIVVSVPCVIIIQQRLQGAMAGIKD